MLEKYLDLLKQHNQAIMKVYPEGESWHEEHARIVGELDKLWPKLTKTEQHTVGDFIYSLYQEYLKRPKS